MAIGKALSLRENNCFICGVVIRVKCHLSSVEGNKNLVFSATEPYCITVECK